jgi:hypothetical protein
MRLGARTAPRSIGSNNVGIGRIPTKRGGTGKIETSLSVVKRHITDERAEPMRAGAGVCSQLRVKVIRRNWAEMSLSSQMQKFLNRGEIHMLKR